MSGDMRALRNPTSAPNTDRLVDPETASPGLVPGAARHRIFVDVSIGARLLRGSPIKVIGRIVPQPGFVHSTKTRRDRVPNEVEVARAIRKSDTKRKTPT